MKKLNWVWLSLLLLVVVGSGLTWALWSPGAEETVLEGDAGTSETVKKAKRKPARKTVKKARKVRKDRKALKRTVKKRPAAETAGKPPRLGDEEDEAVLNVEQKKVMADLQAALDRNDLAAVREVLKRLELPEMKTGAGGEVPVCMRARAVEALGWFGKGAAIDLIGYLGDPNEGVATDALGQFELSLEDSSMSDFERSELVVATAKAINDPEIFGELLTQLNNMRNSVKADTVSQILTSGTPQAQQLMKDEIEGYLDDGVTDVSGVKQWMAENPDDEGDPEMYGGDKSEDAGKSEAGQTGK